MPAPSVPNSLEVQAWLQTWKDSNLGNYYAQVQETTAAGTREIRIVVENGEVRAAQVFTEVSAGEFGEPAAMNVEEANFYTIDAVFDRIVQITAFEGPVLYNLDVVFDPTLGYPSLVTAQAAPSYNEEGELLLNREHNFSYAITADSLFEDIFGVGKDPILTLTRSGGPDAWCDKLRIYADNSSIYTDDCSRILLQLSPPLAKMDTLNALSASFGELEDVQEVQNGTQVLAVAGSGQGAPSAQTLEEVRALADELVELLSKPVGEGLTLLFSRGDAISGLDMTSLTGQPASLAISGTLYGALVSQDETKLYYADDAGLKSFDLATGNEKTLLGNEAGARYVPLAINAAGAMVIERVDATTGETLLGWTSVARPAWNDLPLPEGVSGYGCITGISADSVSGRFAIAGLGYGDACNINPGLTIVDVDAGTAVKVAERLIGDGQGGQVVAGAYTPAWSPDGEWIAFGLDEDASSALNFPTRLCKVRPDGSGLGPISNNTSGVAAYPVWDQTMNVYYGLSGLSDELNGIYLYSASVGEHSMLLTGSDLKPSSLSPSEEFLTYTNAQGDLYAYIFSFAQVIPTATNLDGRPAVFIGWLSAE